MPNYSGDLSRPFWTKIGAFRRVDETKWNRLYSMGCKLQNLEYKILKLLSEK